MIVDDDPDRGQEDDVDVGMAEDPEEVLPQQRDRRRAAASKKCEAEQAVELEEACSRGGQRRQREHDRRTTSRAIAQQKSGIRLIDIPGARSLKIVTMKLIAPTVVEIAEEDQPEAVEVDVRPAVELLGRRAAT